MEDALSWFAAFRKSPEYQAFLKQPVAYFSAEFAISPRLPVYAGGLGILAGDTIKEACDQVFPMVGVGLFYKEGYASQKIDEQGNIVDTSETTLPQESGLSPVVDKAGKRVIVSVPIHDRLVSVAAWVWQQGTVSLYLLDTNIDENSTTDQHITNRLYSADKETRLKQEMILGIGGIRLLLALGIHPSVYHLNEGHSAMLILDLVRHEMEKRQVGFHDAVSLAKRHIAFTNHTLVSSGHEVFSNDLVSTMFTKYAEEIAVPYQDIVELGLVQDSSQFSMTMLALRTSNKINAVSKLHKQKALEIWSEHPMDVVTNGIHIPTWGNRAGGEDIWLYHQIQKQKLLQYINKQAGVDWKENEFLIGWARRIVAYKRPLALLSDIEAFRKIAQAQERPIRVVIAGFPHPRDSSGARLLQEIQHIAFHELKGTVVYLPQYNLRLARLLTAGCDLWLNTPVVGFEACGTSGMKAALNGVLPLTTKDGWVDEAELYKVGWVVENDPITQNILHVLEKDILPMYYDIQSKREEWVAHMRNAYDMAINQFSATKMLRTYIEKMYLPVLAEVAHQ